jgi:dolichol-phosphate mannosyltransferase
MNIVVIMPTYNEAENVKKMVPVLEKEVFPKVKNHVMHLLVVDDKSPDGTGKEVEKYMKEYKNVHLLSGEKNGLGAAYVRGMKYAMTEMKADAVIEFDADFQHDPQDIPRLIAAMDEGADYVIGSRYIPGGSIPKEWGFKRVFLSKYGGSMLGRAILGFWNIHDITAGLKLTKTSFLKKVDLDHLYSKDFAYKMQILHDVVKLGAKVKEVPVIFYERKEGTSKISQKDQFDSLYVLIRLRMNDMASFFKFLVVGGFGFVINAVMLKLLVDYGHWNPSLANLAGAAVAIFSNFNFNNLWTFSHQKIHGIGNYFLKLVQFYATSAFGVIFIQTGTIFIGDHFIGRQWYFLYFIFGTGLLLVWNFTIYNKFIWKKKKE